jgi:indolepyruvate ferredoxin oxidoreductase beta subunit
MMVVNRHLVLPTSVYMQNLEAPIEDSITAALGRFRLCLLDADQIALEAGNPLSQNIVMLGAASHAIPLKPESLIESVKSLVPEKTIGINTRAFYMGRLAAGKCPS